MIVGREGMVNDGNGVVHYNMYIYNILLPSAVRSGTAPHGSCLFGFRNRV